MKPSAKKGGFTLIELLVAITIAVVLTGLLISVTSRALDVWQRMQSRLTMNAQVKVALDLLARDLQAVVRQPSNDISFAVDVVPTVELGSHNWRLIDPLIKPDDAVSLQALANTTNRADQRITDARFGRSGVWLRMIASSEKASDETYRLPRAISYQISRCQITNNDTTAPICYTLYRTRLKQRETFTGGYGVINYSELVAPDLEDALCDNVVDFGLWCYVRQPDGSLGDPVYPSHNKANSYHGSGVGGTVNPIPDVVDVMLRVLTESGAARLEQMELGRVIRPPEFTTDEEWWWAVVESESQVFTMRIEVGATATP